MRAVAAITNESEVHDDLPSDHVIPEKELPSVNKIHYEKLHGNLISYYIYNKKISKWYRISLIKTAELSIKITIGVLATIFITVVWGTINTGEYTYLIVCSLSFPAGVIILLLTYPYSENKIMFGYVKRFDTTMNDLLPSLLLSFSNKGLGAYHCLNAVQTFDDANNAILEIPNEKIRMLIWEHQDAIVVHVGAISRVKKSVLRKICGYIDDAAANA